MNSHRFTENDLEEATLAWFQDLGYDVLHGPQIAPEEPAAEREHPPTHQVVLDGRLRTALGRLNPSIPRPTLDEAFRQITRPESPSLIVNNRTFHQLLVDGVEVEYARSTSIPQPTTTGW
jgi:type I restriction enzyme R subunit